MEHFERYPLETVPVRKKSLERFVSVVKAQYIDTPVVEEKIKDKKIYDKLTKIVNVTQKITKYLETKPTNATKIYNFMDYYLTYTTKIVTKYIEVDKKEEKTFVENQLFLKLNVYLKEIETECNRLLSEIAKSKDRELDFEMKVFEKTSDLDVDLNVEEGSDKNA